MSRVAQGHLRRKRESALDIEGKHVTIQSPSRTRALADCCTSPVCRSPLSPQLGLSAWELDRSWPMNPLSSRLAARCGHPCWGRVQVGATG